MSRDDDMLKTIYASGVGNLTIATPSGQETVVDTVNVSSVTGGPVALVLSGTRTINLGPVGAGGRVALTFPDALFVGDPNYSVGLTVPADGVSYIGGYQRHQRV